MRKVLSRIGKTVAAAGIAAFWLLPPGVATASQSFAVDLTTDGVSQFNVAHTARGLRLGPQLAATATEGEERQGFYVTTAIGTRSLANRIRPIMMAETPPGADILLELRGQTRSARWTEWREARQGSDEVVLPASSTQLQARITLTQRGAGQGPEVYGLRLLVVDPARGQPQAGAEPAPKPLTSRVFATRIGQIGDKTANGHTIATTDRFVALPSRRALNANTTERAYEVKICYATRCVVAPIWDVGPWNIRDDYWNAAATRDMWADLPQGKPQAQAAYLDGYNAGRDDRSRKVRNPAGIDLADELFWQDLGMTTNDWVNVTYLWTDVEALL
ncbi:hypothetical protein ACIBKY_41170 [Nonomuraea sp. NPDC050394]|uniref:hypothetical protein n=1 Tax=Nonomuraea sp. NPDC050394 TaxID=3364363 RepID=UPI00378B42AA